jgi:CMP/dCMP kinase
MSAARKPRRSIVVAISGPPGVGTSSVSKIVAKKLGIPLLMLGRLQKSLVRTKNESKAALLSWHTAEGKSSRTHVDRDRMQVERAKKGNVVINGKLAVHFLKDLTPYKVWIHAPLNVRAKRASLRDNIPYREAYDDISHREKIERKEWKRMYGFDYFGQRKMADLSIDSSDLTLRQTADRVVKFVRSKKPMSQ